jgi:hypothetical protein
MPQYTTIDEVKGFVGTLEEQRALTKAVASKSEKNTFLSHSSKDNDLVPGVALVLTIMAHKFTLTLATIACPSHLRLRLLTF